MPPNQVKMLLQKLAAVFVLLYNIKIVEVSGENGISITFAIDDTRSMYNVIDAVKIEAKKILDEALAKRSQDIKDFVLVTINDPDVILRTNTSTKSEFLENLNNIRAHNYYNRDCPEMSMSGIYEALLHSRPGSYVFVFTDASAKDNGKVESVKNLAQRKQIQVIFILTGDCNDTNQRGYRVYSEIAKATSGQIFRLKDTEMNGILDTIRELLHDLRTVSLWKEFYICSSCNKQYKIVTFTVDEKTDNVIITANGDVTNLQITQNNRGVDGITWITWTSKVKVAKLAQPKPGTYKIRVDGSGQVSIVAYATTDFTFEHGFSTQQPTSLENTSKQPTNRGIPQHLCINVTDPENSVKIQYAQLLDMDGGEVAKLPLYRIGDNFYMTRPFVAPTHMFNIKITGEIKSSGKQISRVSKTPVKPPPRLPHTKPEVHLKEGKRLNLLYDTNVTLTCNVKAYPEPQIVWTNGKGVVLKAENSEVDAPAFISYLKLNNLQESDTYRCRASNDLGSSGAHTEIIVRQLFRTISSPAATTNVKYGEKVTLRCDIQSDYPMNIRWLNSNNKNIENNVNINLSADKKELTLESVELETQGTYTCEGFLTSDADKKINYKTDVKIVGLLKPKIENPQKTFFALTGDKVLRIPCSVTGYPEPVVTWKKKDETIKTSSKYEVKENALYILNPVETDTANYTCQATNVLDSAKKIYEVIIRLPDTKPEVNLKEGKQLEVKYGTEITLTCNVKAHPEPEIIWTNSKGVILQSNSSVVNAPAYISNLKLNNLEKSDTYLCRATNSLGSDNAQTEVTVRPLFTTISSPAATTNVKYGEKVTLRCDIQSEYPMNIRWLKSDNKNIENNVNVKLSADKKELTLESVDLETQGTYTCEGFLTSDADKKINYKTDVKIVGLMKPKIENPQKTFFALTGDKVLRIPCNVTGYPEPVVTWTKYGETIKTSSKYEVKESALYILNPVETDTANYTCEATNVLGSTKKNYEAIVFDKLGNNRIVKGNIHMIYAIKDTSVTMKCNISNSNTLPVRWYSEGQLTNHTGSSYQIEKGAKEHSGIYTCRVNSDEGSSSESFDLYVGSPPRFTFPESSPRVDWYGNDEWLDCSVVADPEAEVRWFLNGVELPNKNNDTQEYNVQNYGEYKCLASNVFGSVERTYEIVSKDCFINEHMATQNMPLWLNEDTTWPKPSSSAGISLKANESIELICALPTATANAFQEFPTNNRITAKCYKEDKFVVEGKVYDFLKLQCKTKVEPLIENTHKECSGPQTETIQVGFTVDNFLETYRICYDTKNNVPLFGSTPIIIEDFGGEQSLFKWSQSSSVGGGNPSGGYTCQTDSNCCYMKSQMVAVDEVVFGPAQAATLKDNLNSVAVWIPCKSENKMSWMSFEDKVKAWSSETNELMTWTGASEYRNKNGGQVPRYLWKVIKNNEVSTVVVYENDPKPNPSSKSRCSSLCDNLSMPDLEAELNSSNSFYCCTLDEFSKSFGISSQKFETTTA